MKTNITYQTCFWFAALMLYYSVTISCYAIPAKNRQPYILDPKANQSITGTVSVALAVPADMEEVNYYHMKLDDEDLGSYNSIALTNGMLVLYFLIHTYYYSNGAHTISCFYRKVVVDKRNLDFKNFLSNFVYNSFYNPHTMFSCGIKLTVQDHSRWSVYIKNIDGKVIRAFHGQGTKIDIQWDGKDDYGHVALDGNYQLVITCPNAKAAVTGPITKIAFDK